MFKIVSKKNFCSLIITLIVVLTLPLTTSVSAESFNDTSLIENEVQQNLDTNSGEIAPNFVNPFRHKKEKVKNYYSWSGYKRVSDNIRTGKKGGSITANRSVTFKTSVTGTIAGLGISTGGSVSSSIGYKLNVGANKRVYLGYRVRYKVEEGINHYYDVVTGKTIWKKRYVVKRPLYGEYKLINYR
ncbi:MAG TPA: hypothetical protein VF095_04310 [Bacillota bacterium]